MLGIHAWANRMNAVQNTQTFDWVEMIFINFPICFIILWTNHQIRIILYRRPELHCDCWYIILMKEPSVDIGIFLRQFQKKKK